jgi:hypothetical protein
MLQTVYREIDFDDEMAARQQRDAHLAELQAQGMECVAENLYNAIEGWRVFTLVATPPGQLERTSISPSLKPSHSTDAEAPQPSERPKRKGPVSQEPQSARTKRTYDVR